MAKNATRHTQQNLEYLNLNKFAEVCKAKVGFRAFLTSNGKRCSCIRKTLLISSDGTSGLYGIFKGTIFCFARLVPFRIDSLFDQGYLATIFRTFCTQYPRSFNLLVKNQTCLLKESCALFVRSSRITSVEMMPLSVLDA